MNSAARQTLRELRSLGNIQTYLCTAKAELASDPCDEKLRAFIVMIECLLSEEKAKLIDASLGCQEPIPGVRLFPVSGAVDDRPTDPAIAARLTKV